MTETPTTLTDSDKEFIRAYVAEVTDGEEKKQRRKELADQFGVSLPTISAVTAWTKIRANRTVLESRPIEIEEEEVKQEVIVREVDSAEGSHVNYDNAMKRLWREKWKAFLARHTLAGERQKMKVLCLPGKKCLEIPLYLDLGFRAENITGVEGGDEAAKMEFHQNAYRYGIIAKLGRLENLLQHEQGVYDVVSLDFTGPISKTTLDIIKLVPIAPAATAQSNTKSYFMINLLAKREQKTGQLCLDFYASFTRPEMMQLYEIPGMDMEKFQSVFGYVTELADKAISGERFYEEEEMKKKRDIGIVFLLNSLISKDRRFAESQWSGYRLNEIPLEARQDMKRFAGETMHVFFGGMSGFIGRKLHDVLAIAVPQIIEAVTNYRPFICEVDQYQYSSPVNNANSPFITEMYQIYTPMADYIKLRYVVRFFVDAILWLCINEAPMYIEVRDKHGHPKRAGNDLQHKDTIGFVTEEGFVISSIPWHRVAEGLELFVGHIDKDKSVNILTKGQNARINLSEQV